MRRILPVILILAVLGCFSCGTAYSQCVDSSLITNAYCDPHYDPVCGCNGTTYKNDCFARDAGVTQQNYYYGICGDVDFDFNPNPVYDIIYVDAILKNQGDMYVQLFDRFGNIMFATTYPNVLRFQFQIDARGIPPGIYYLNIFCLTGNKVRPVIIPGLI
jgi:hypothetical protein